MTSRENYYYRYPIPFHLKSRMPRRGRRMENLFFLLKPIAREVEYEVLMAKKTGK